MKIKSLKEGLIDVGVYTDHWKGWYWEIDCSHHFGFDDLMRGYFETKLKAKNDWKRLVKLNGWKNWKFI